MQNQPLVTVYIPTFNRVELLKRAVKSVQDQTYQNLEIIIVDDCSTDGTHEYLEQLAKEDSRVRYFLKETNSGACVSRNIAIENAKGEFITGLDDDDYFKKNRISLFLEYSFRDSTKAYYSLADLKIDENKFIIGKKKIFKKTVIRENKELLKQNFVGNQIFVKTAILLNSGGFDTLFKAWQDLECWYNLQIKSKIVFELIPEATQVIDISHSHERITTKKIDNVIESFNNFAKKHNLSECEKRILHGQLLNYQPSLFSFWERIRLFFLTRQFFYIKSILKGM